MAFPWKIRSWRKKDNGENEEIEDVIILIQLRYLLADQIVDYSSISIPQSRFVRAPLPMKKKFGFEKWGHLSSFEFPLSLRQNFHNKSSSSTRKKKNNGRNLWCDRNRLWGGKNWRVVDWRITKNNENVFQFVDATDGRSLPSSYPVTQLDSFFDPSTKRKMTNGEVGCFLSHYRWDR